MLSVSAGEIVPARIRDVERSVKGAPGELCGVFEHGTLGRLQVNAVDGVYGTLTNVPVDGVRMPLAMKQEVTQGRAQVLTTVDGTEPALYDIIIRQVRYHTANDTRSMVIEVTDETLLSLTGGIVQGMSGSPIIQNGKLIGAVTHVLVDDPTKGYAIFAENMLETAQSVANEQLKEAS
jgi:stage IV sporulation protein B